MKKRLLPFIMAVLAFGQFAIADNGGHYVPRTQGNTADCYMGSLRANQHTGLIDPALMLQAVQNQSKGSKGDLYWLCMGPDNMGGQTTAVLYDNQTNVVYIGSKGGGVYRSYNQGITWHQVGNQNLMVSCMTQDASGVIYVGTGDGGSKVIDHNGLGDLNYSNSFIGSGIYTINASDVIDVIASTVPAANDDQAFWSYVNDMVFAGNKLVVATDKGVKYSADKGATWYDVLKDDGSALTGIASEVRSLSDGTLLASVDGKLYIGTVENMVLRSGGSANNPHTDSLGNIIDVPNASLLDMAIAPSNENIVYVAGINASGVHSGIYVSYDKGETWTVALPGVSSGSYSVYEGYGQYNHGIVVDPSDAGRLYILGYNLWKIERTASETGNFLCEKLTTNTYYYSPDYLHVGLHSMAFNPKNNKECYIGTDGGVYKANVSNGTFTFSYSNRNYLTTRMFNVAFSGKDTRVLAAGVDHGTVLIEGDESHNNLGTGEWINPLGDVMGVFSEDSHAGSCAISMINPNTIFVTTKGGKYIYRSETSGDDWVSTNFTESQTPSNSAFRMPILIYENYDDDRSVATVWIKNTDSVAIPLGTTVKVISNNHYPFDYTFQNTLPAGDSIEVHDPISAKLYYAVKDAVYMTNMCLDFAKETVWYQLTKKDEPFGFNGDPTCMSISADGDNLFVGMKNGGLYRLSNLNSAVDSLTCTIDTTSDFQVTTKKIALTINGEAISQCVTSVAVDPRNANNVIVTLGNYGNDCYVMYSTNALSDDPTFTSKQGNLPKMPVYSSVIEMATGDVILGTEHGIYSTSNINSGIWAKDSEALGDVPVMELKQQLLSREDIVFYTPDPEGGLFKNEYPGVHNTGIIYAATYGRGVFRCENYKQESGFSVPETPAVVENTISLYPNPVRGEAVVSFNVSDNASVSYQVYDLTGRMVMSQNMGRFTEGEQEIRINTENLSTGSYILRLSQGNSSSCVKFMVL